MSLFDSASLVVTPNGYKEDKLYSIKPTDGSGDLVITRATTATRVNSAGLIELVPYNFLERSQEFDNVTFWGVSQATISANATVAPDGTNTADKLIESNTNDIHEVYTNTPYTLTAGSNYTKSVFAKSAERTQVALNFVTGGFGQGARVIANLSNGTLGTITNYGGITESSATITNVGNGWYRISITIKPVTTANFYADFAPALSGNTTYLGNGTSGIYIWGAQLVAGTSSKEYFPTTDRLNVPRIDYTNGTCPNILVEPQRTNIALRSEEFDNAAWTKSNSSISANSIISPSGIQNADKFIENNGTGDKWVFLTPSVSFGTSYTYSVYAKKGERDFVYIYAFSAGINITWFNLNTGTIGTSIGGGTASIQSVGNGWYRCSVTITTLVGTNFYILGVSNADNVQSYTGNGTSGIYIWGAQVEAGSYATSYIPTVASTVTRNADVISKTGISSLIGQTEGTILLDFVLKNPLTATNRIFSLTETDWLFGGSIRLDITSSSFVLDIAENTATSAQITYNITALQNTRYKVAIAYKLNDCKMYVNGVDAGSDTSTIAMPTCSELYLNALGGGFNAPYEASNINTASLWKTRLTNAELAQLTTI